MQLEVVAYKGWKNCLHLSNGIVDMLITLDVGPRIIRFGFVGKDNDFAELAADMGQVGGDEWRSYGGHRLWHSPEVAPRTYYPDNFPVKYEDHKTFVRIIADPETGNDVQKEMDIELVKGQSQVKINHRIRNLGLWPVELAPWAISVVAPEGVAIVPLPPRAPHAGNFVPLNILSIWPVTDMSDARYTWGREFVMLRQNPKAPGPQKFGALVPAGWAAYANKGHLFLKQFPYIAGAAYPDGGCNAEFYNQEDMAEIESLGPVAKLQPGAVVEHPELWTLLDNVPQPKTEADIKADVLPKISEYISKKI